MRCYIRDAEPLTSALAIDGPIQPSNNLKCLILRSCHLTLIHLGDLSRWRETQLVTQGCNWGPAIGYYELASRVCRHSGEGYFQMAIISRVGSNVFDTTYYLYRALAVAEPHQLAGDNLQIHLRSIIDASQAEELNEHLLSGETQASREGLISAFLLLHAYHCTEPNFARITNFEADYLKRLKAALDQRSLETTVSRIFLINLAAEYHAGVRYRSMQAGPTEAFQAPNTFSKDPRCEPAMHSHLLLRCLNVRTFCEILRDLQTELNQLVCNSRPSNSSEDSHGSAKLSTKLRRIVPWLRLYSAWLLPQAAILAGATPYLSLNLHAAELGVSFAQVLELLRASFLLSNLPNPDYLLEEDENTVGFLPLDSGHERIKDRYQYPDTDTRKPHWYDEGVRRLHPTGEMLSRIQDIFLDGFSLVFQGVSQ